MTVHYMYMESEGNPETDPLILWSNGGPGASSLFGMFTEWGPLELNNLSLNTTEYQKTGIPSLLYNDEAWTKIGSVVLFDWPPPVGFSYCNGNITGDGYSCGDWDDTRMAQVSYSALEGFLQRYPNANKNGLFLTGESYAGVYIPKLGEEIVKHDKIDEWNFKGLAIGDPCLGTEGKFLSVLIA